MKHEQWLLNLLPQWREEGLLNAEAEEILRRRHTPDERKTPLWFMFLGSIGALLVGLGIITLFAANWEVFGRPARAALSFAPLCLSLALYGAGVWRGWDKKTGFPDVAGILWALSVGACIALIAQTYQISSDGRSFVLAWTLLLLPVMYATRSFIVVAGHYVGLLVWMIFSYELGFEKFWVFPLALLGAPIAFNLMRAGPENKIRGIVLRWVMVAIGCVAYGFMFDLEKRWDELFLISMYGLLFSVMLQIGFLRVDGAELMKRPWAVAGLLGFLVMVALYAFGALDVSQFFNGDFKTSKNNLAMLAAMASLWVALCAWSVAKWQACHEKWLGFYPLVFGLAPVFCAVTFEGMGWFRPAFWYFAILGAAALCAGLAERKLGRTNLGMLILLSVSVEKFFTSELSMTVKAVLYLVSGVVFFVFSFVMGRVMRNGRKGK